MQVTALLQHPTQRARQPEERELFLISCKCNYRWPWKI